MAEGLPDSLLQTGCWIYNIHPPLSETLNSLSLFHSAGIFQWLPRLSFFRVSVHSSIFSFFFQSISPFIYFLFLFSEYQYFRLLSPIHQYQGNHNDTPESHSVTIIMKHHKLPLTSVTLPQCNRPMFFVFSGVFPAHNDRSLLKWPLRPNISGPRVKWQAGGQWDYLKCNPPLQL